MHSTQPFINPLPTGVSANHRYVLDLLVVAAKLLPEWKEMSARFRSKPAVKAKWEARLREHRLRVCTTWTDAMARDYSLAGHRQQVREVDVSFALQHREEQLVFREVRSLHELVAAACAWPSISVGGKGEPMQLRTNSTELLFENLENSGLLTDRKALVDEYRKVTAANADGGVDAAIEDEQQSLRRRFFVLVDRMCAHGDALRTDLPDRQRLAWLSVGELPRPTEHQIDDVYLRLVPSTQPAAQETFALAHDLSRWISTKSQHYRDLAAEHEHDTDDAWLLAASDWADARSLDITRARALLTWNTSAGEDRHARIPFDDAVAGRPDLDLEPVPYKTLMRWMKNKDRAAILGCRKDGQKKGQSLLVAGIRELLRAGEKHRKRVAEAAARAAM